MISQPGAGDARAAVRRSPPRRRPRARSIQLAPHRRARGRDPGRCERSPTRAAFTQLARLAIPVGLGDQAPLIAEGVDAVAISSAGERPLAADEDGRGRPLRRSVDDFGRAVQSIVGALDVATEDPIHGPRDLDRARRQPAPRLDAGGAGAGADPAGAAWPRSTPARGRRARGWRIGRLGGVGGGALPAVRRRRWRCSTRSRSSARSRARTSRSTPASTSSAPAGAIVVRR